MSKKGGKKKQKNDAQTTATLKLSVSSSPRKGAEKKNYPKSARHAKTNTDIPRRKKTVGDATNIKPSSTRSSKYKDSAKRNRSKTQGNVLKGFKEDNDDEKHFFKNEPSVDDEFALPDFIKNAGEGFTRELTTFEIRNEGDIGRLDEQFDEFEKILNIRRRECIETVRNSFDNSKYIEVKLDISGTNEYLTQIGTLLGEKEFELNKEQALCIDKLREIIYFEDHSKDASEKLKELQKTLAIEADKLEKDKARVKAELAKVEPQLRAAKQAVSGIPKSSLDEFRALRKPAPILVDVVRAVAILVGKKEKELKSWGDVRKNLDSKFIDFLLNFDAKLATRQARKIIEVKYLDRPDFTFERINQASTVAGPFVFWLQSQIDYAKLLEKVSPIQREVERLQDELKMNELRAKKLQEMLVELGKKVKQCRADMMEMVRKIVKLQDDIKEARKIHNDNNNNNNNNYNNKLDVNSALSPYSQSDSVLVHGLLSASATSSVDDSNSPV